MPSIHLMINLGEPFVVQTGQANDLRSSYRESWCIGLWSHAYTVEWAAEVRFYGIHFKPGGAAPFLHLPLSELHNEIAPLDAIWRGTAGEIRERLHDAPNPQAGLALLERLLLARLCEAPNSPHSLPLVQSAIAEIEQQHGALPIRELGAQIGVSQSYLDTHFRCVVGISPKELARFYRFAYLLSAVDPAQSVEWTRLAHQLSFYDQSHFNREFAAFTGLKPTEYLQQRRRIHARYPGEPQTLGQLAIE